ncbi:D-alanine--D-alanine ligase [Dissulfuribacter thermophilus]|uniref:D-alanine--D-alanine ligase n=1 Tax=Dissulfuribacter thermophilus TaxID=1156395 RepID=A0A1B9F4T8_9BACT|nr:D-alanine--D-alanine ligase [Dissulfuribacter thermophilus]
MIYGGKSAERDVSIAGARQVKRALLSLGYEVFEYDPLTDLKKIVEDADRLDGAFLVLHGAFGEDGRMQGFLDMLGIPYQGAGVLGSALSMDKHLSKTIYVANDIPTPQWSLIGKDFNKEGLNDLLGGLRLPLMVKPRKQGSSVGMGIANDIEGLKTIIDEAFKWDDWVILEEFIEGRELSVGVLEGYSPPVLPPVEIIPGEGYEFFDYEAKYTPGATKEVCPAPVPEEVAARAQDLALKAHRALCLKDYSRTDMILSETGELFVIETNTIPGMTETSLFPQEAKAVGLEFEALIAHLVERMLQ